MKYVVITNNHPVVIHNGKAERNVEYTNPDFVAFFTQQLIELGQEVVCYNTIKEFKSHIFEHLEDYVINFDFGFRNRTRNMDVPALCDLYGIKCMNPRPYAQLLCQDKFLAKEFVKNFNISIPKSVLLFSNDQFNQLENVPYPLIIKPNCEANSIGIDLQSVVHTPIEARKKILELLEYFDGVIAEEYIDGREVTIAMLQFPNGEIFLKEREVVIHGLSKDEPYIESFEVEYGLKPGVGVSLEWSAFVSDAEKENLISMYKALFQGERKIIRIDGRVRANQFYLIEINANPGLNNRGSFVPYIFLKNGYSYTDMLKLILGL